MGACLSGGGGGAGGASLNGPLGGKTVEVGGKSVRVLKLLAEGGKAYVYEVECDGRRQALKHLVLDSRDGEGLENARREATIHRDLPKHAHIVEFIATDSRTSETGNTDLFVLMGLAEGGRMPDIMNARMNAGQRLSEREILKCFRDTADALAAMHSQSPPIAHRDLKVENVLWLAPGGDTYQLCDFGSCSIKHATYEDMREIQQEEELLAATTTEPYRSPEMVELYGKTLDERADLWAMGVLLYKLCFMETPFEGGNARMDILKARVSYPPPGERGAPAYSEATLELIRACLVVDVEARPVATELVARAEAALAGI